MSLSNTSWQVFEKIVRTVSIFLTIQLIMATHGAEAFGQYSFTTNNFFLFLALANFGTSNFISAQAVDDSIDDNILIMTIGLMRGLTSVGTALIVFFFFRVQTSLSFEIIICFCAVISLSFLEVFESWNIGKAQIKRNLQVKAIVLFIGLFIKYCLFLYEAPWTFYAYLFFFEYLITYVLIFLVTRKNFNLRRFNIDLNYLTANRKHLIPLAITAFLSVASLRVDQYIIIHFLDYNDLGMYNILLSYCNLFGFFPLLLFNNEISKLGKFTVLTEDAKFAHYVVLKKFILIGVVSSILAFCVMTFAYYFHKLDTQMFYVVVILSVWPMLLSSAMYQAMLVAILDYKSLGLVKMLLCTLLTLFFGYILVSYLGLVGMAIAMVCSVLLTEVVFIIFVDNQLRENYYRMFGWG